VRCGRDAVEDAVGLEDDRAVVGLGQGGETQAENDREKVAHDGSS
jgi:hypothetical protein